MKNLKLFNLAIAAILFFTVTLTSCGGGGLPNGRYAPTEEYKDIAKGVIQAIIIDGDNFTTVFPFTGQGITVKYKYENGTLSFSDGVATAGIACEFKNDTLWWSGIPFTKTN
ncbi:MAG: hypothetical protein LBN27_13480 [Prevotellaceae bacterium]|jgi:hypothetical protein|nr:hypothetical protein [Prevotellaceae bacterium]